MVDIINVNRTWNNLLETNLFGCTEALLSSSHHFASWNQLIGTAELFDCYKVITDKSHQFRLTIKLTDILNTRRDHDRLDRIVSDVICILG